MTYPSEIASPLLKWYDCCARSMPWRGIHDPYKTWVSETMLQQTRVETVIPYYERFLARFPTLKDLAAADEADILKMWEGLGYYSRARNLLKGVRQVMEQYNGTVPHDPKLLAKISGIGPYTAGAIASIAYDVPVPAVDGNVLRVFSRLFGIRDTRRCRIRAKSLNLWLLLLFRTNAPVIITRQLWIWAPQYAFPEHPTAIIVRFLHYVMLLYGAMRQICRLFPGRLPRKSYPFPSRF